ncbi:MAG: 2'-5' RNA ligase family protein [Anaerolineae bacterium]|nr:2'-5' RNA ligase family protein [Anaerolineae bacterium]
MYGVVLLLPEKYNQIIQMMYDEWVQDLGVDLRPQPSLPHVSIHIAEKYDAAALRPIMAEVAAAMPPLTLSTSGLGLFTGLEPVLHVAVTCGRDLLDFHARLHARLNPLSQGSNSYYQPGQWMPHITLSQNPHLRGHLPHLINQLSQRDFSWQIPIRQLAYINKELTTHEVWDVGSAQV